MIIYHHTPSGLIEHELSQKELEQLAEKGDHRARVEIASGRVNTGIDLNAKVNLLAWVLGIIKAMPEIQKEI